MVLGFLISIFCLSLFANCILRLHGGIVILVNIKFSLMGLLGKNAVLYRLRVNNMTLFDPTVWGRQG